MKKVQNKGTMKEALHIEGAATLLLHSEIVRNMAEGVCLIRTKDGGEIDIINETAKGLIAAEVKLSSSPGADAARMFSGTKDMKVLAKKIICTAGQNMPIGNGVEIVSAMSIW